MFFRRKRKVKKRSTHRASHTHYAMHREFARDVIHERLEHWNSHFDFSYNRVSIKNQRRCWGSCSEKGNLNFNYRVIFLPQTLMDYVIVHELCHLAELNHSKKFWEHIARALPEYKEHRNHLKRITQVPATGFPSSVYACTQEVKTSVTLYPS